MRCFHLLYTGWNYPPVTYLFSANCREEIGPPFIMIGAGPTLYYPHWRGLHFQVLSRSQHLGQSWLKDGTGAARCSIYYWYWRLHMYQWATQIFENLQHDVISIAAHASINKQFLGVFRANTSMIIHDFFAFLTSDLPFFLGQFVWIFHGPETITVVFERARNQSETSF